MKQIKGTTKPRKRLFFNTNTKTLFVETKVASAIFRNDEGIEIPYEPNISKHPHLFIDLSLFPGHIFKNYGVQDDNLYIGKIVWVSALGVKNKDRKLFLAKINSYSPDKVIVHKISTKGIIDEKRIWLFHRETTVILKPQENYKVISRIKLI